MFKIFTILMAIAIIWFPLNNAYYPKALAARDCEGIDSFGQLIAMSCINQFNYQLQNSSSGIQINFSTTVEFRSALHGKSYASLSLSYAYYGPAIQQKNDRLYHRETSDGLWNGGFSFYEVYSDNFSVTIAREDVEASVRNNQYITFQINPSANGTTSYGFVGAQDFKTFTLSSDELRRYLNSSPSLSITSNNHVLSEEPGHNTLTISGKVSDPDQDNVTVSATIGGKTKSTTIKAPATMPSADNWTLRWDVKADSLPEGRFSNIDIKADDQKGGVTTVKYTGTITIDKTAPSVTAPVLSSDSTSQVTIRANATDNGSGLHSQPYQFYRNGVELGTWQGNQYRDSGLNANTQYTYSFKARDAVQNVSSNSPASKIYTRALDPLEITIENRTANSITFGVVNNNQNGEIPEFKIDIKKHNGDLVGSSPFSNTLTGRTITDLSAGEEYEVWVQTRNGNNLSNPAVKMMDKLIMNRPPTISLDVENDQILSEQPGYNKYKIKGTVKDEDIGDELTIKYTLEGIPEHYEKTLATFVANGEEQYFEQEILIDSIIPEGSHTIKVWAEDDKGSRSNEAVKSIIVKKSVSVGQLLLNDGHILMQPNDPRSVIPYKITLGENNDDIHLIRVSTSNDFTSTGTYIEHEITTESLIEANIQMPIDEIAGRTKTVYVQFIDQVGNSKTIEGSVFRNLQPTLTAKIEPKLDAVYPKFYFEAHDEDGDEMSKLEIAFTGPQSFTKTIPYTEEWTYNEEIEGELEDGSYIVNIQVFDEHGLASEGETLTFSLNTRTDDESFIIIPPQDGEEGNNPPDDKYIGVGMSFAYTTGKKMENTVIIKNSGDSIVRSLPQGIQEPNSYVVIWDGKDNDNFIVPSGRYTAVLISFDGKNSFENEIGTVLIDTMPPVIEFDQDQYYNTEVIPVRIKFSDETNVSGEVKVLDPNGNVVERWPVNSKEFQDSITPTIEGEYRIVVKAMDEVGNVAEDSFIVIWDLTPPEVTLLYQEYTSSENTSLRISATDSSGIKSISLDNKPVEFIILENGAKAEVKLHLKQGENEFIVEVTDAAGNKAMKKAKITYTIPSSGTGDSGESGGSSGEPGGDSNGNKAKEPTWEEIVEDIIGLPKDTIVIDLRDPIDTIIDQGDKSVNIIGPVDPNKILNKDQLKEILDDVDARISLEIINFEDAIGLRIIVIGKDGSVNILTIDIPLTARYKIPEGEDPNNWGVFRLDKETKSWVLVPYQIIDERTLEAQVRTGNFYKAMPLNRLPIDVNSWAKREIIYLYNMRAMRVDPGFDPKEYISTNEVVNILSSFATEQQFEGVIEALDVLNMNKPFLAKQEIVMLANLVLSTELELTLENFASKETVSLLKEFKLNTDESMLLRFADHDEIFDIYRSGVATAANYKLIVGEPDYHLHPNKFITKEEAASLLVRYANFYWNVKHRSNNK